MGQEYLELVLVISKRLILHIHELKTVLQSCRKNESAFLITAGIITTRLWIVDTECFLLIKFLHPLSNQNKLLGL